MVRISSVVKFVLALFQWSSYVQRHYMFTCCDQVLRVRKRICASFVLVAVLRIATLHVYLLRSSAARTLEALFLYKEAVAHETFLQTCFVKVSCGCRSTCLHEMLPRHNSLRHKTNERIGSINNILLTMGLLTIWRLFLLLFVSKFTVLA